MVRMWRKIYDASRETDMERLESRADSSVWMDTGNFLRNTVWWVTRRPLASAGLFAGNILHTLIQTPKWVWDVVKKTKNSIADVFSGVDQVKWFKKWMNVWLTLLYSVWALWEWVLRAWWEVTWWLWMRLWNIGHNLTINSGEIWRSLWTIDPASKAKFLHYEKWKPQHFKFGFKNARKWLFENRNDQEVVVEEPVEVFELERNTG